MSHGWADIAIGVIDVGSPKSGNLGWAILAPNADPVIGKDLDAFVDAMTALGAICPLAIGIEAPLFIPTPAEALRILSGRRGEGSRPWSTGAGATVTTVALAIATYTLAGLRQGLAEAAASTDFVALSARPGDTLFFEAFVTRPRRATTMQTMLSSPLERPSHSWVEAAPTAQPSMNPRFLACSAHAFCARAGPAILPCCQGPALW